MSVTQSQPDVALDHLELALQHLALARAALLGATPSPVLTVTTGLTATEASPGNPYGSGTAKHGTYTAPTAAAVAEGVETCPVCESPSRLLRGSHRDADGAWPCVDPWHELGHLPESKGGQHGCVHPGCHDHVPAPTAVADAGRLAAHAPEGAL